MNKVLEASLSKDNEVLFDINSAYKNENITKSFLKYKCNHKQNINQYASGRIFLSILFIHLNLSALSCFLPTPI